MKDAGLSRGGGNSPSPDAPEKRHDLRILQALRRIIRAVELHSRKLAAEHKITAPQLVCLLAIQENEPVTATIIARLVHLSPSTVVGILDRLEKKGLAQRERDRKDRRLVNVTCTDAGRALASRAPSPLQDRLAEALTGQSELEQATISLALERVVDLMEAGQIDAAPVLQTGPMQPAEEKNASPQDGEKEPGDHDSPGERQQDL